MYSNRVSQKLHEEHMATLALLERIEHFIARKDPPEITDIAARTLLIDLAVAFESEVWNHFDFEEKYLFEYFTAAGDSEMTPHLMEEHEQIRDVGVQTIKMARAAASSGFSVPEWKQFRNLAGQLAEQLTAHVHKEEGVLVPLLQDAMESDSEEQLYMVYVMGEENIEVKPPAAH
jgi:hemerythrin-like domain-containing protein